VSQYAKSPAPQEAISPKNFGAGKKKACNKQKLQRQIKQIEVLLIRADALLTNS